MILRLTDNLSAKTGAPDATAMPLAADPLTDFTARLFLVARTQYVLVSNTASLYSVLLEGRGLTSPHDLITRFLRTLDDQLQRDGFADAYAARIAPRSGTVMYARALNRSVTGSMNDLAVQCTFMLLEKGMDPDAAGADLNGTPLSMLIGDDGRPMGNPREVMRRLLAVL